MSWQRVSEVHIVRREMELQVLVPLHFSLFYSLFYTEMKCEMCRLSTSVISPYIHRSNASIRYSYTCIYLVMTVNFNLRVPPLRLAK